MLIYFLRLALVFQIGFASFAQIVVGPLVNMVLFITVMMVSPVSAMLVGVLTPLIAFLLGIMGMFPLVPVLAIGNMLLVIVFSLFYRQKNLFLNEYIGLFVSALVKFVFSNE